MIQSVLESAGVQAQREQVATKVAHWRRLAASPLTETATAGVCRVVLRSLAEISARIDPVPGVSQGHRDSSAPGDRAISEIAGADDPVVATADVMLPRGPRDGLRQDA